MPEANTQNVTQTERPDFGNGRYSALMNEVYDDAQVIFKLDSAKSEKLAQAIARELGAIMAAQPAEIRLGKVNKDGKLTISEAAKVKNVTLTNSIYALKALHFAAEAGKNGFVWAETQWKVNAGLIRYFESL